MRTNRKGFTLIELLAVIVILAIIALITVPVVIKIINNAKKGAAEDSAYGVVESAKLFWASNQGNFEANYATVTFTCHSEKYCDTTDITGLTSPDNRLDISGTKPTNGNIVIANGEVTVTGLQFGEYYCSTDSTDANKIACSTTAPSTSNSNNG